MLIIGGVIGWASSGCRSPHHQRYAPYTDALSAQVYLGRAGSCVGAYLLEEVIALVVDDDECREVLHLDAPDGFHPEFGILEHLDRGDVVLSESCGGASDRAKIETSVVAARVGDLLRTVSLGEHDHRAACSLEAFDIGIHTTRSCRAERS